MNKPKSLVSRRTLFAGAGAAGAVAAAATLLPGAGPQPAPTLQASEPPPRGGGYHLSDHVRRYYKSTLV